MNPAFNQREMELLACPDCKTGLAESPGSLSCPACRRVFPISEGIVSFLTDEERFNQGEFEEKQIANWTKSSLLRTRVRNSRLLSLINAFRQRFSLSGRRDRLFLDNLRNRSAQPPLILDLGCGGGRPDYTDFGTVVGIDPVMPLLRIARQTYPHAVQTGGFHLPFRDETFDFVVSSDVVGHIENSEKDALLLETRRILKKGGVALHCIETDATNPWFRILKRFPAAFQTNIIDRPGHIGLELPDALWRRLEKNGFRVRSFKRVNGFIVEPGSLNSFFDGIVGQQPAWLRALLACDRLLGRSYATREPLNLILEILAQVEDRVTPINWPSGVLVACERPRED